MTLAYLGVVFRVQTPEMILFLLYKHKNTPEINGKPTKSKPQSLGCTWRKVPKTWGWLAYSPAVVSCPRITCGRVHEPYGRPNDAGLRVGPTSFQHRLHHKSRSSVKHHSITTVLGPTTL